MSAARVVNSLQRLVSGFASKKVAAAPRMVAWEAELAL